MMTRFTLTLVLGVLLSLGTVVTGGFFGQAQAGNWNAKNGQEFGMPEIRLHFYFSTQAGAQTTSDFDTLAKRLGHLTWYLFECEFYSDMAAKKIRTIDTEFLEHASLRDRGLFRESRFVYTTGNYVGKLANLSKTQCNQTRVSEVINIIDKTISWLKENPGSNLPELSEWQSKILKKADVGVTQVVLIETAVQQQLQELGALTIEPNFPSGMSDRTSEEFLTLSETLEPPELAGHMFWWASLCKGHKIAGVYNKEWTGSFKRLASQRDWALFRNSSFMSEASNPIPKNCSPGKVNQVNAFLQETLSWLERNEGSNLSNYFKGQSDGFTQAASVGTTSSNNFSAVVPKISCKRVSNKIVGFNNDANGRTNFDSWFPNQFSFNTYDWIEINGRRSLKTGDSKRIFQLLPSGEMIAGMASRVVKLDSWSGYQKVSNIRYKCNKTSIEVAALLDKLEKQPVTEVVEQQTPTQVNDPFAEAKAFCSDLGFTSGTEKHGNCVLKIASNSGSEAAPATNEPETASDKNKPPTITIASASSNGPEGTVKGRVTDRNGIAEVRVDGQVVQTDSDGNFTANTYVPASGKEITIEAIDTAALSSTKTVSLKRGQIQQASGPRFDVLDPTAGKRVKRNVNALALIVGISNYKRTDAPAVYADKDAQYFHDYAYLKLGIPDGNIKTMVNAKAEQGDVVLAVKDWMRRSSKPGKTDVYVFFAGHGLASDDGEQMYLLPYDGRPRLLDKTAILRQELFDDIASANPRSVTVFLDTCYSGTTRGTDMLIASRPIAIKALEQSIPDNFTVMTAARGDQTAKPLEEAKHGMFSYFLMKGMEGTADKNQDNKITAGELHQYVQSNVVQQSSGSQTPELQGDAGRVLVRFQ